MGEGTYNVCSLAGDVVATVEETDRACALREIRKVAVAHNSVLDEAILSELMGGDGAEAIASVDKKRGMAGQEDKKAKLAKGAKLTEEEAKAAGEIPDGGETEVAGSGMSAYRITRRGDVIVCTCPAWQNQGGELRTCKHIQAVRGAEKEKARIAK